MTSTSLLFLTEEDIPGASLSGKSPELLSVVELKRWLACRGAHRGGTKSQLIKRYVLKYITAAKLSDFSTVLPSLLLWCCACRVNDYLSTGLAEDLVDPDNGANVEAKRTKLLAGGSCHSNLSSTVPSPPTDGWLQSLADLPDVSFATLYKHFVDRKVRALLDLDDADGETTSRHFPKGTSSLRMAMCRKSCFILYLMLMTWSTLELWYCHP